MNTIAELREALSTIPGAHESGAPDLATIRRRGRRRRRTRQALGAVGTLAFAGIAVLGVQAVIGNSPGGSAGTAVDSPTKPTPTELSSLAERVLAEVPGAERVSAYQVVIPGPGVPADNDQPLGFDPQLPDPPEVFFALSAHAYTGVTMYPKGTFPNWLYRAVSASEQAAGDDDGYPVGSFAEGVIVDQGPADLVCVTWPRDDRCSISLAHQIAGDTYLDWGMGTEDFLMPGKPMEIFQSENFSSGAATTFSIAGMDGEDVATVDFVNSDGRTVEGTVLSGNLMTGDTIMWADVPGELARVTAYDAAGEVVENHKLKPCSDPVDCEVR